MCRAMDPISATTTLITLATFLKDLLDLGQNIRRSVEKVKANRRLVLALADDIFCTLVELRELTVGRETDFMAPHLVRALEDLKSCMLHALSHVEDLAPVARRHGLRGLGSHLKIWLRRHDTELAIQNLKDHVNKCFIQFTVSLLLDDRQTYFLNVDHKAFSVARTEYTTLRVENAILLHHVENSVKLQRLEDMIAESLLDSQIRNNSLQPRADTISSAAETYLLSSLCDASAQMPTLIPGVNHNKSAASSEPAETRRNTGHLQNSTLKGGSKIVEILTVSGLTSVVWWILLGIYGIIFTFNPRKFERYNKINS
ncbi:Tetratricopeptide repeat family [Mycena venus]|uniref:Tetratricopeptide repeat family n=1 Tax=Mycena venus TaxID=2733690 RepID=A0A8H7D3U3_9AGAR|nr:Tetratricopeptide repeat family [Mycena venus]